MQKAYLGYADESDETRTDLQPVEATMTIPAVAR